MRKSLTIAVALATAATPTAAAAQGKGKDKPKPAKPYCVPQSVGYNAKGTLVSASLAQTAGADTQKRGDDRYSGEMVVDVAKANQKGATGEQAFTAENVRVKFHPGEDTEPAAGDRVKVTGKVTKFGKKCANPAAPVITVKKVDIKAKRS